MGPKSLGQVRVQRVRGLDRVLRAHFLTAYSLTIKILPHPPPPPLPVPVDPYAPMARPVRHLRAFDLSLGLCFTSHPIHHAELVVFFHAK